MKIIQISPSGFVAPYQLGVCMYIKNHYNLLDTKFIGGSAGSWLSVYMASDINNDDLLHKFMPDFMDEFGYNKVIRKWRTVGKFLKTEIPRYISSTSFVDEKRIMVSLSNIDTCKLVNEITDDYSSLDELMELCYLSSFIPLLSGDNIPVYKNKRFVDATFTKKVFNKVDLFINPTMWGRKFYMSDYVGYNKTFKKIDYHKLLREGYLDAMKNKRVIFEKLYD